MLVFCFMFKKWRVCLRVDGVCHLSRRWTSGMIYQVCVCRVGGRTFKVKCSVCIYFRNYNIFSLNISKSRSLTLVKTLYSFFWTLLVIIQLNSQRDYCSLRVVKILWKEEQLFINKYMMPVYALTFRNLGTCSSLL